MPEAIPAAAAAVAMNGPAPPMPIVQVRPEPVLYYATAIMKLVLLVFIFSQNGGFMRLLLLSTFALYIFLHQVGMLPGRGAYILFFVVVA